MTGRAQPWPLTLLVGQLRNREAEALGRFPWWGAALAVVLAAVLAAFPFINDKFTTAVRSTNPGLYPGLTEVFATMGDRGWVLKVEGGRLTAGAGVPGRTKVGAWLVVVEPAGGGVPGLEQAVAADGSVQKVAFFGTTRWGLLDGSTEARFDGTWTKLEGFTTADLGKVPAAKLLPIILFAGATGDVVPAMAATFLLMFVQVVFLTVVLGFLLSLSKVQIAGTPLGARRGAGFAASLKATALLTPGPALLVAVALSFFPGASALSWVVYTLLLGLRIVVLYMGRFSARSKARPAPERE